MHYRGENTKSIISQKLRIAQKKTFVRKMIVRSIRIFSVNLVKFEQHFFCEYFVTCLATITQKTINWTNLMYDFSFVSAHCTSFMRGWPLLRGGTVNLLMRNNLYAHSLSRANILNEHLPPAGFETRYSWKRSYPFGHLRDHEKMLMWA